MPKNAEFTPQFSSEISPFEVSSVFYNNSFKPEQEIKNAFARIPDMSRKEQVDYTKNMIISCRHALVEDDQDAYLGFNHLMDGVVHGMEIAMPFKKQFRSVGDFSIKTLRLFEDVIEAEEDSTKIQNAKFQLGDMTLRSVRMLIRLGGLDGVQFNASRIAFQEGLGLKEAEMVLRREVADFQHVIINRQEEAL